MNGQISAAFVVIGAMVLFAGSAADRAGAQTSRQSELHAAIAQDNSRQQAGQPQSSDYPRRDDARRDDTRRPDDDRARRDERGSDAPAEGERVTPPPDTIISVRIADEINSSKNHTVRNGRRPASHHSCCSMNEPVAAANLY